MASNEVAKRYERFHTFVCALMSLSILMQSIAFLLVGVKIARRCT